MRRLLVLFLVLASTLAATPAFVQAAPTCQYILGFKTLHDLAPTEVGNCLDNQAFAANGDALQHTTNGLLVWRKVDNWTAFTNGYWTWINGPYGLAKRLNTQRFSWEANPDNLPIADLSVALRPFVGSWVRHGASMELSADGTAELRWRMYVWCSATVTQPCDEIIDNVIVGGGLGYATFDQVHGNVASGQVYQSTDQTSLVRGPISFTLQANGTAVLSQSIGSTILCNPNAYNPDVCGA